MTGGPDDSYERIKAAAVDLFARRGYVATGIRDIAKEAGFSSAALYHHVQNKEELLVEIMREGFEALIASADSALTGTLGPEAKLDALVCQHVMMAITQQTRWNVVTVEYRFLGPAARERVLPLRDAYAQIWADVIEEGARDGAFNLRDTRLARLALLEMCEAPSLWYRPDGRSSGEEIAAIFAEMALNLVRARRPPRAPAARAARA